MRGVAIAWLLLFALSILGSSSACSPDDDDDSGDDSDQTADDNVDDDDAATDDDDDDDDDDNDDNGSGEHTCEDVAYEMGVVCGVYLDMIPEHNLEDWCEASKDLFGGEQLTPFWECGAACAFVEDCDQVCFDACIDPPDPGGTGCEHVVDGIYACGVVFVNEPTDEYYILEMDAMAACGTVMADRPWDCFDQCAASLPCSTPPTADEAQAMISCMNACS